MILPSLLFFWFRIGDGNLGPLRKICQSNSGCRKVKAGSATRRGESCDVFGLRQVTRSVSEGVSEGVRETRSIVATSSRGCGFSSAVKQNRNGCFPFAVTEFPVQASTERDPIGPSLGGPKGFHRVVHESALQSGQTKLPNRSQSMLFAVVNRLVKLQLARGLAVARCGRKYT
jgi:hypothetical protein